MPLSCRFYKNKFPEIEDTVMANVRAIAEMGAYVQLTEYKHIEGMILLSELSRRRIRSINKLIRVGRTESVKVIRVDTDKGYIDLSKRRVDEEQKKQCEEQFAKAKAVHSILRHVGELLEFENDDQLEDLYERTAWFFDEKFKKKAASFDVFKQAVQEPSVLNELKLSDKEKEVLMSQIKQKLTAQPLKIRSDIEVSCFSYEGIDAVKEALRSGLKFSTDDIPLRINLIAPPVYVVTATTLEKAEGFNLIKDALEKIEENIKASAGNFKILAAPKVVSARDEEELAKQLEKAERDNAEVSGDDDDEEEEVGMGGGKNIESGSDSGGDEE